MGEFDTNSRVIDAQAWAMSSVRVIAYPAGAGWTGVLRRAVEPLGLKLVTARSTAECRETLERRPASLLVLELTPGEADEQLQLIAETARRLPQCRVVVFQRRMKQGSELLARELGACEVFSNVGQFARLRVLAKAHLTQSKAQHEKWSAQLADVADITSL